MEAVQPELWDNMRLRQCQVEDTAFQLLQLGQHQTRSWRGNWMWFLKDWQGCVLTLGASDISEGWQVEQMWILQGVCCGHAEHHPEVRGPECGLMCGHRCTELVYSCKFTCKTSTKEVPCTTTAMPEMRIRPDQALERMQSRWNSHMLVCILTKGNYWWYLLNVSTLNKN